MNDEVPLFDSHGGATLDGTWLDDRQGLTFAELRRAMTEAGFLGGLVQGLPGVCGYEHRGFADAARGVAGLWPVAAWDGSDAEATPAHVAALKDMGFVGVHAHPRASGVGPDAAQFRALLQSAGEAGLPVFYCAYQFADVGAGLPVDPLPDLAVALRQAPSARLVLLHGGTVEVLRYAEFTRANPRVLLDLSFTMMRYAGTSLDADLGYVFRTLDRRVCIGTDAPEYSPADVRARFEALTAGLPLNKRLNIAGRSLTRFLGLDLYPPGE
jgi:predicted TIM-barrel fold metal-dependent hydrolase